MDRPDFYSQDKQKNKKINLIIKRNDRNHHHRAHVKLLPPTSNETGRRRISIDTQEEKDEMSTRLSAVQV